jgi:ribosomal protein L22
MADKKDPKDEAAEKPAKKPRTPRRRKPAAEKTEAAAAAATTDEATTDETTAADDTTTVDEPTAETAAKRAAGTTPAARKAPATKAKAAVTDPPEGAEAATVEDKPKPARRTRRKAEPDPPAAPAAQPKRASAAIADGPPMVRAHAKYVRTSARKARLVCDHIRGKSVDEARAILAHANRDVARDWSKLLESAVANAEHNHELLGDDLRIHAVKADEGPTLKRFRPRAMGRATKIRKRTSHLSITLTPKDGE